MILGAWSFSGCGDEAPFLVKATRLSVEEVNGVADGSTRRGSSFQLTSHWTLFPKSHCVTVTLCWHPPPCPLMTFPSRTSYIY